MLVFSAQRCFRYFPFNGPLLQVCSGFEIFDTKHQIWCLDPLKTTEVGLLISVGTRAYIDFFFFFCRRYPFDWFIEFLLFFQNRFCDAFPHIPQIVSHPAYMPWSPNKYTSDLKSFYKCHYFKATYSFFTSGKPETLPVWNTYPSRGFQFLVLFPRGCQMENACFSSRDSHLNWTVHIPKEQRVKLSRTENLNYSHLNINTCTVGESVRRVKVASLGLHIFTTHLK